MGDDDTRSSPAAVTLTFGAVSHTGSVRTMNEDSFLATDTICLVADGMGGHAAGEVASQLVVEAFEGCSGVVALSDLEVLLDDVNTRIRQVSIDNDTPGMGTTVVGVGIVDNGGTPSAIVFNVGDSRCYRLATDGLEQVTVDHSHVQELITAGKLAPAEAVTHPMRHVVTRALGSEADVHPDFKVLDDTDCRLLLCSDGLSGELGPDEIRATLEEHADPEQAALALVERVLAGRAGDNITAVVVDVRFAALRDDDDTVPANQLTRLDTDITAPRAHVSGGSEHP